ncbi:MAG TPA: NAD(P)-dependent oxidoreductase [Ktedonosporobacter sp.]|nr:NAD(P)-dependent oxidoreductase [Ktedonosporobacter sp.]
MEVFVTGATRVLGRPVVQQLIAAGHHVRGLSRSQENEKELRELRAEPVAANLFDVESLKAAVKGCDAILHLATRIPPTMKMGRLSAWLENDRIRRDGTRNLVEAALAVGGVQTIIYPSFFSVYADSGDKWIDAASTPVQSTTSLQSTLDAEEAAARFASTGNGRRGISLRMGAFYGPEAPSAMEILDYARKGIGAYPGRRDGYVPHIWLQDAASAIVVALTEPVPSGIYDIVDDEPLTRREMFDALAQAVGRKHLLLVPDLLMRPLMGTKYDDMSRSIRISNRRFKEVSNWQPTVPNAWIGWARIGQESARGDHSPAGMVR